MDEPGSTPADNWVLHFAQEYALGQRVPLAVVFCLLPVIGEATIRQYSFMLRGLTQTATRLLEVGIPFFLLEGTHLGLTGDPLWNAAQTEMVCRGTMPGYLRMYWAKKLLEWTVEPEEAHCIAIRFNDRYLLDGRDPNGYTGIAWSLGGLHDGPWNQRPVFGHIRWMSLAGVARKFNLPAYIARVRSICQTSG